MTNTPWIKLKQALLFLLLWVICVCCFAGCSEPVASKSNMNLPQNGSNSESEVQTDRPPTVKTLYAIAEILASQGRDNECELVLKRILREYPKFLPAYNSLAELQMRQRHVNEAIKTISKGLAISPRDSVLLNNLGMCWIIRRDYEKSLVAFTTAAGVVPENVRYRANMAVALGLMGRYEESLALFKQILPEGQANHNVSVIRGVRRNAKPVSPVRR